MPYMRESHKSIIPEKVMTPLFKDFQDLLNFMKIITAHAHSQGELPYLDYCKLADLRVDSHMNSMMQYYLVLDKSSEYEYVCNNMGCAYKIPIVRRIRHTEIAVAPSCFGEA